MFLSRSDSYLWGSNLSFSLSSIFCTPRRSGGTAGLRQGAGVMQIREEKRNQQHLKTLSLSFSAFRFVHWKNSIYPLYSNGFFVESIYVLEVLSTLWHVLALPADIKSSGFEFEDSGSVCLSLSHRHTHLLVPAVKMWAGTLFAPSCPGLNCEAKLLRFHIWSIQAECYTMSIQTVMLTLVLPAWKHAELEIVLLMITVLALCLCKNPETVYDPGWSFHVLSAFAGFRTKSKDMYIRLIWDSELPLGRSLAWGNHPSLMLSTIVDDLESIPASHGWRCWIQAILDKSQDCFSYISYYCNYSYMLMLARPLVLSSSWCLVN